jgi:hypothetical protein
MSLRTRTLVGVAMIASVGLALPATAEAGHRGRRDRQRVDVDIKKVKAELRYDEGDWRLSVDYEVKIKDASPRERFELFLDVAERVSKRDDYWGPPARFVVPLTRPSDVDDDEIKFKGRFVERLPDDVVGDPKKLRVHAAVLGRDDQRPLDQKETSVKFKKPKHRGRRR